MSTRSLTFVLDPDGTPITCIYRHMDGYLEGHGTELCNLVAQVNLVNGLPFEVYQAKDPQWGTVNGADELAALLVWALKDRYPCGNVYLEPPAWPPDDWGQEYEYYIVAPELGKPGLCYRQRAARQWGPVTWLIGPRSLTAGQAEALRKLTEAP